MRNPCGLQVEEVTVTRLPGMDRISKEEDIRGTVTAWEMFQRYSQRGQTETVLTYM